MTKELILNPPLDEWSPGDLTKWTLHHSRLNITINANDIYDINCTLIWGGESEMGTIDLPSIIGNNYSDDEYLELMKKQGFTVTINKEFNSK